MHFEGVVRKMTTEYSSVVNYFIEFKNSYIHLNQFLEKSFTIQCTGYSCLSCSSNDEIFRQGFLGLIKITFLLPLLLGKDIFFISISF